MNRTGQVASSKSVRFATTLEEVQHISRPTDRELQVMWYSDEDNERLHHALIRDVVRHSQRLAAGTVNLQDPRSFEDHVIHCVGIDHLLSRDVQGHYQAIRSRRKEHSRRVLGAQQRLRNIAEVVEEDIGHTAEISSRQNRIRAYRVAVIAASV